GASAGDTSLSVLDFESLEIGGRFFEAGDLLVLSPGRANEEFAVVASPAPFTLASSLIFEHEAGSMVAFVASGESDADGDGLTDTRESELGTRADMLDTDGDGLSDGQEIAYGTDPLDARSQFGFVTALDR